MYKRDNFRKRLVILTFFRKKFFRICTRNFSVLYEMYKSAGRKGQKTTEMWGPRHKASQNLRLPKLEKERRKSVILMGGKGKESGWQNCRKMA